MALKHKFFKINWWLSKKTCKKQLLSCLLLTGTNSEFFVFRCFSEYEWAKVRQILTLGNQRKNWYVQLFQKHLVKVFDHSSECLQIWLSRSPEHVKISKEWGNTVGYNYWQKERRQHPVLCNHLTKRNSQISRWNLPCSFVVQFLSSTSCTLKTFFMRILAHVVVTPGTQKKIIKFSSPIPNHIVVMALCYKGVCYGFQLPCCQIFTLPAPQPHQGLNPRITAE